MRFYRVNNPNDSQIENPRTQWIFVHNELYTEKEFKRLRLPEVLTYFDSKEMQHKTIKSKDLFQPVEVSKKKTRWFFGARFEL